MQNENVFFTTDKYSNLTDEQIISQIICCLLYTSDAADD